jgi:hypothetical protein
MEAQWCLKDPLISQQEPEIALKNFKNKKVWGWEILSIQDLEKGRLLLKAITVSNLNAIFKNIGYEPSTTIEDG